MRILEGMEERFAPLNDWMHDSLRPHTRRVAQGSERYDRDFDKLELLIALNHAHYVNKRTTRDFLPAGQFGYKSTARARILDEIKDSLSTHQDDSPYVTSQVFGRTSAECVLSLEILDSYLSKLYWW